MRAPPPSTRPARRSRGGSTRHPRISPRHRRAAGRGTRPARPAAGPGRPGQCPGRASAPVEDVIAARGSQRRMNSGRGLPQEPAAHGHGCRRSRCRPAALGRGARRRGPGRRASTAGPTCRPPCAQARSATSSTGCAWVRRWPATPRSSSSPRPAWAARRPRVPRGAARGRPGRRAAAPGRLRARRQRLRDDVSRQRGAAAARRAADALLFTCVGVPDYTSAAAGPPGAPAAVRRVTKRS